MMFSIIASVLLLATYPSVEGCGRSFYSAGRVIGGSVARHGAWPWQILLLSNGRPGCGGSIINPTTVVTASHCVVDQRSGRARSAYTFTVRVGDNNRRYRDADEKDYRVSRVYANPNFSFRNFRDDVAVLKLSSPIQFNRHVQPVCLASKPLPSGTICYITGWGRNNRNYRDMSYQLKQAPMPIVDPRTCNYYMRRVGPSIGAHSLCSGYGRGRISGCQGDSGGPFVCKVNGKWELHGAVSWGSKDCSRYPNQYTVYANIFNLKRWIENYA